MKRNGFSLIEVVAAVTILTLIFSGISALHFSLLTRSKKMELERDTALIQEALSCYLYFHADDPEGLEDVTVDKLIRRGFLIGENKSPWNVPYKLAVKENSIVLVEAAARH